MADRYFRVLEFTGLSVGVPASLPHELNFSGLPQIPHFVTASQQGFEIAADLTSVTVTRQAGAPDAVDVMAEVLHTLLQAFGGEEDLAARPFVSAASGANEKQAGYLSNPELVSWYVRPTGDDANDGTSPATAFATIERAWDELKTDVVNLLQRIDATGMKGASKISKTDGPLHFPILNCGINTDLDPSQPGPDNLLSQKPMQLVASPDLVQGVTIAGIAHDADTNLTTVTVNEVLVPNAHVDQILVGSGPFEFAAIVSNTTNQIQLASSKDVFTGPVGIYEHGAEISSGDPLKFFTGSTIIVTGETEWLISGIKFSSTDDSKTTGLNLYGSAAFVMQMCQLTGLSIEGTAASTTSSVDASAIFDQGNNASLSLRNVGDNSLQLRHCFYRDIASMAFESAWIIFIGAWFEAPQDPVGRQHGAGRLLNLEEFEIANAAGVGLRSRWRTRTDIKNGRIRDSGGDAVDLMGGNHRMDHIVGANNGGGADWGARMSDAAQLQALNGTSVSGGAGDVLLGGAGGVSWASAPNTDVGAANPQFCRLF